MPARAATQVQPLARPAIGVTRPASAMLLDVTRAGDRLVAVGEHGVVILSDDDTASWRQANVPVSTTLTRVRFVDPLNGWAVGHYGVVLKTGDGGQTWQRQLEGSAAARLALDAARPAAAMSPGDEAAQRRLAAAEQLVNDGPDKPFFDLHFFDPLHGLVVGAYNLIFATEDGGKTWTPWLDRLNNPKNLHLYAVAAAGDTLYIAGEQGLLLRSRDRGRSFGRVATPYAGSYFALKVEADGRLLLAGLRGNAFRSGDDGATWTRLDGAPPISFSAIAAQGECALLVNQAGQVFRLQGTLLAPAAPSSPAPLTAVLPLSGNRLLGVGRQGAGILPMRSEEKQP